MTLPYTLSLILIVLTVSCSRDVPTSVKSTSDSTAQFQTMDYLDVAKVMRHQGGPFVVSLKNKDKRLVVVGCPHSADTAALEFNLMELYFKYLEPQIAFNEGGQVSDTRHYNNRNDAIRDTGEIGLLKYLCDQQGIKMVNGDFTENEEFTIMLTKYSKDDLFVYYAMERFFIPYHYGFEGDKPVHEAYENFIKTYLVPTGFPLAKDEQSYHHFAALYEKNLGVPFDITTADLKKFDFLSDAGKYTALARTSKELRDSVLLKKIQDSLHDHDRVFVAFGGAHVIAIESALNDIIRAAE